MHQIYSPYLTTCGVLESGEYPRWLLESGEHPRWVLEGGEYPRWVLESSEHPTIKTKQIDMKRELSAIALLSVTTAAMAQGDLTQPNGAPILESIVALVGLGAAYIITILRRRR